MPLLLDTHFLIAIARGELDSRFPRIGGMLMAERDSIHASVASIWEIAIKNRLGKLNTTVPLDRLGDVFEAFGLKLVDINRHHAVAYVEPDPATQDPFDRMLLAQCKVEQFQLVTVDRALTAHPLAWRSKS